MSKKLCVFFCIGFAFISFSCFGQIYRSVEPDGTVIYSDQPNTESENIALPDINVTTQPASTDTHTTDTNLDAKKKTDYTQFKITAPTNEETFQNATEITVTVSVKPKLQNGDKIQYLLDNSSISEPVTDTSYTIPKISGTKEIISRGTHTISAQLISEDGNIIKTTPAITIYAHYVTLFSPARSMNNKP